MPKCTIDGNEVEFEKGENLIKVAKRAGVDIPVFCYHPGLSVVAQCRMCLVEIEKMPKLQTACSTPAGEGMIVRTQANAAVKGRAATMEFLLANHPLDCPICDKSGECDLQDNSFTHGSATMRTTEERRTYVDVDMGPVIQKNMNRCIHCTRCIRFGDEVAGIREMVSIQRGNMLDITTIDGLPLATEYAGNYADICPTGALTLKDFRFKKRAWFLKKTETICEGCSKGCNMEVHHEAGTVYRCLPRYNPQINQYWLCDEGRFNYHHTQDPQRIVEVDWSDSAPTAFQQLKQAKNPLFLIGTDLCLEEMKTILDFAKATAANAQIAHFGTPGVLTSKDDAPEDKILKRTSKTSNLNGAESLGIKPFDSKITNDLVIVFRGGRAVLPQSLKQQDAKKIVAVGVFRIGDLPSETTVLPGLAFTEKSGTIVNFEGTQQKLKKAVPGPRNSKPISEILMIMTQAKKGSVVTPGIGVA